MSPEDVREALLDRYSMEDLRTLLKMLGEKLKFIAEGYGDSLLACSFPTTTLLSRMHFSEHPLPEQFQELVGRIDLMLENSRRPSASSNKPPVPNCPPLAPDRLSASVVEHPSLGTVFVTRHAWERFLSRVHELNDSGQLISMKDRPELAAHLQEMFSSSVITRLTDGGEVRRMINQHFVPALYFAEPSGRFRFVVSKTQPHSMLTCEPVLARRVPRVQPPNRLRHK